MSTSKGTALVDFQGTIQGVQVILKKGDAVDVVKKCQDGFIEILYNKKVIKLHSSQIDAPDSPAEKKKRGFSVISNPFKRLTVTMKEKVHTELQAQINAQLKEEEKAGNSSAASTPSSSAASATPTSTTAETITTASPESAPQQSPPQTPKKKEELSEEQAKKIIGRNVYKWYLRKQLKLYCQKSPELKDARLRKHGLQEILSTEVTYVQLLNTCMRVFYEPLKAAAKKKKYMNEKQLELIFSNLEQVKQTNEMFLAELERVMSDKMNCNVGKLFEKYAPFFKVYTTYVNNFDGASALVEQLEKKDKKFAEFLRNIYATPDCAGQTFIAYLILPVQRIPRYRLLLQELIKRTPAEHVDYKHIESALSKIVEVAAFVNEAKRKEENSKVLYMLQEQLGKRFNNLLQPHRFFVRQGRLKVTCERKEIDDWYVACLFNDMLILKPETPPVSYDGEEVDLASKCEVIYFAFADYIEPDEEKKKAAGDLTFQLEAFHGKATYKFTFAAENDHAREEWESDISTYIVELAKLAKKKGIDNSTLKKVDRVERKRQKISQHIPVHDMKIKKLRMDMVVKEEALQKQDTQLREAESQYEAIWNRIEELRSNREKILKDLTDLKDKESAIDAEFSVYLTAIRQYDSTIWTLLNGDLDAFHELFEGDDPVLPEEVQKTQFLLPQQGSSENHVAAAHIKTKPVMQNGENPYYFYHRLRQYELQSLKIPTEYLPEEEIDHANPLFGLRPPPSNFRIEQETLAYKYRADRLHYGYVYVEKPPTVVAVDPILNNEELYMNEFTESSLADQEVIPEDIESLKKLVMGLRAEVHTWKTKFKQATGLTDVHGHQSSSSSEHSTEKKASVPKQQVTAM